MWGWATWADRWHRHRAVFDRDHAGAEERVDEIPRTAPAHRVVPATIPPEALVTDAARSHFADVAASVDGDERGWDHHWWVTIMTERGLSTIPSVNLVENDGYGEGATHTRADKDPVPAEPMPLPMTHPAEVALNREVEAELELILLRTDGRLSRWARRLIRPLWLRSLVRRVIDVPASVAGRPAARRPMSRLPARLQPAWPLLKRVHRLLSLVAGIVFRRLSPLLGARGVPVRATTSSVETARLEPGAVTVHPAGPAETISTGDRQRGTRPGTGCSSAAGRPSCRPGRPCSRCAAACSPATSAP